MSPSRWISGTLHPQISTSWKAVSGKLGASSVSCYKSCEPNPYRFRILNLYEYGKYLVAVINYPDCKNYEGNKVLIYKDVTARKLMDMNALDPHFFDDSSIISPIARFRPDVEGIENAKRFVRMLYNGS